MWRDFHTYTSDPSYQVHIDFRFLESTLDNYVNENNCDLNPSFQRAHVWNRAQQTAFVEHTIRGGGRGSNIIRFNNFGGHWRRMVLVDGKQRLEAVRSFMRNEFPVFGELYFKNFEGPQPLHLCLIFMVNTLTSDKDVLKWYLEINEGGTPHTKEELDKVRNMLKDAE